MQIGKINISHLTFKESLDAIVQLVLNGSGGIVFTPNVDHIVLASQNQAFAESYERANLILPDGMPLVWASRLFGKKIPERVAGSDVLEPLLKLSAHHKFRVYFLGSKDETLQKAAEKAKKLYPNIKIVGYSSPLVSADPEWLEIKHIMKDVQKKKPQIIIVALGAPKQELFISQAKSYYHRGVYLGLGASLDFFANDIKRAPLWMQKIGLEWSYRLAREPRRLFKRYLRDLKFPLIIWKELRKNKRR